jgi:hypothetical protein
MTPPHSSVHLIYLHVPPADIALVKFLLESYEGVGIVRTVDRHAAIIVVLVVEDFLPAVRAILAELETRIACTEVDPPALEPDDWLMRAIREASRPARAAP